jgi:hypothetical protein
LFERLAALENRPRDQEAVRAIEEGLQRAPNAVYALVQSVLVQDEALKRADARIRQLEQQSDVADELGEPRGFLDNMREVLFGEDERRSSVPSVRSSGTSAPSRPLQGSGATDMGERLGMQQAPSRGGSFLGTAAAAAAGVIGGGLLLDSIRGMFNSDESFAEGSQARASDAISPWGTQESGDLARQAGIDDLAQATGGEGTEHERSGLFEAGADPTDEQTELAEPLGDESVEVEDADLGGDFGDLDFGGDT